MIVTVVAMRMVQVAIDQVIRVVAVRDGFMTAAGAVLVSALVAGTLVLRRAGGRVIGIDRQPVFLNSARGHVVEVAIVEIIHVAVVVDGRVPAAGTVLMVVLRVIRVFTCQGQSSFRVGSSAGRTTRAGAASNSAACSSALLIRSATCRSVS
jgi:hypothetical protein